MNFFFSHGTNKLVGYSCKKNFRVLASTFKKYYAYLCRMKLFECTFYSLLNNHADMDIRVERFARFFLQSNICTNWQGPI